MGKMHGVVDECANLLLRYADVLQRWSMCLGKHNLTGTEPSERCFGVSGIYRHEDFKYPTVPSFEFDIALVRLDRDVIPSDQISYACLPSIEEVLPGGKKCYATGWGDETGTGDAFTLPFDSLAACSVETSFFHICLSPSAGQICCL